MCRYRAVLVKGSPFITIQYEAATPLLTSNFKILSVDQKNLRNFPGAQYLVTLDNYQKWLVYSSEPITFVLRDNSLVCPSPIRGVVRIAVLPLRKVDAAFALLMTYVQRYPVGASVSLSHPSPTSSIVNFQFSTIGSGALLMLALPHQVPLMSAALTGTNETKLAQNIYSPIYSIKGKLSPIVGDAWKLTYNMPLPGWNYALTEEISLSKLDEIGKSLTVEVKEIIPSATDVYTFGKQVSWL